jgi:hypothetical protein
MTLEHKKYFIKTIEFVSIENCRYISYILHTNISYTGNLFLLDSKRSISLSFQNLTNFSVDRNYTGSLFLAIRSFAFVQKHRTSMQAGVAEISQACIWEVQAVRQSNNFDHQNIPFMK